MSVAFVRAPHKRLDAAEIVRALGGKWNGRQGMCRCPAHDDKRPSLSVSTGDAGPLVYCFTGCPQEAVIDALRKRGLWPDASNVVQLDRDAWKAERERRERERREEEAARAEDARALYERGRPVQGTPAETYLRSRRLMPPWPACLHFTDRCYHVASQMFLPALLCAVSDHMDRVIGVQRIYLAPDGSAKAAVECPKMTMGVLGNGAVNLAPATTVVGLAEGPETAMSARQMYRLPVWAVLGAHRLDAIALPDECRRVVIFADRGQVGEERAARAADAYERIGRDVDVILPDEPYKDFNDWLRVR